MSEGTWYYCLRHQAVEPAEGCRAIDRLGPYPDRETAAHAVERAHERTAQEACRAAEWNG